MGERIALRVDEGGQRVDRFLAARSLLSRSAIARLAKDGHVLVDGAAVEPAYKVRLGQELVVDVPDAEPALSLAAENIPIDVLYEDEDVIVVNKPAGLVVHPAYGHATGTLVNAVVGRITADTGRAASRPGIVHRLDKDTSGVLVVAKNDTAHPEAPGRRSRLRSRLSSPRTCARSAHRSRRLRSWRSWAEHRRSRPPCHRLRAVRRREGHGDPSPRQGARRRRGVRHGHEPQAAPWRAARDRLLLLRAGEV